MFIKTFPIESISLTNQATKEKLLLADYIMKFFTPLFDEEINRQLKQLEMVEKDYLTLASKINAMSIDLKQIKTSIELEDLKRKIINCIYSLKQRDLLYGPLKAEAIDFITNYSNLDNIQVVNEKLKYFESLISKHVKKVN
jgi:hypothetical protein